MLGTTLGLTRFGRFRLGIFQMTRPGEGDKQRQQDGRRYAEERVIP